MEHAVEDDGIAEMLGEPVICIYKRNCSDSLAALKAVRSFFGQHQEAIEGGYDDPPPDASNHHVILLGFHYEPASMVAIQNAALSVLVIEPGWFPTGSNLRFHPVAKVGRGDSYSAWDNHIDRAYAGGYGGQPAVLNDPWSNCAQLAWAFFTEDDDDDTSE